MPQSRQEDFFKMIFHYMTYMTTCQHKNSCPGDNEIYNLGRPYLGHHYYIHVLSLCEPRLRVDENNF